MSRLPRSGHFFRAKSRTKRRQLPIRSCAKWQELSGIQLVGQPLAASQCHAFGANTVTVRRRKRPFVGPVRFRLVRVREGEQKAAKLSSLRDGGKRRPDAKSL